MSTDNSSQGREAIAAQLMDLPDEVLSFMRFRTSDLHSIVAASRRLHHIFTVQLYSRVSFRRYERKLLGFVSTIARRPDYAAYVKHIQFDTWDLGEDSQMTIHPDTFLHIDQHNASVPFHEERVYYVGGRCHTILRNDAIVRFMLANLHNLEHIEYGCMLSELGIYYDGLEFIKLQKLRRAELMPVRDSEWDMDDWISIEAQPLGVEVGHIANIFACPLLESLCMTTLKSRGIGCLDHIPDRSLNLSTLELRMTNLPSNTLKRLLRLPRRLRFFKWERAHTDCSGGPVCDVATVTELQDALNVIKDTVEVLELELWEQHLCPHHDVAVLDFRHFTRLRRLRITADFFTTGGKCTQFASVPQVEQPSVLANCLPPQLEELELLATPRRVRYMSFWPAQMQHLAQSRARLPALQSVLLAHRPQFALCDECATGIVHEQDLDDAEKELYAAAESVCATVGLTLYSEDFCWPQPPHYPVSRDVFKFT